MTPAQKNFVKALTKIVGHEYVSTDSEELSAYGTDWTKIPGKPFAVARPATTKEVAAILKLCSKTRIGVVPSGGRTGLAGGAVAGKGQLALSLNRMNRIDAVDAVGNTLRVQAGATTQSVHEHCAPAGLTWPIDLASKGTSTVGGNLSTNAGGLRVIRYGMARKWVTGLQAVTMNGEILDLNRDLEKNNTGYDLVQCLVGSEGTLAVITEATLKLTRLSTISTVLLFSVNDVTSILSLFEEARRGPFQIGAFEFFSKPCLRAVQAKLGRKSPFLHESEFYVLMEIEPQGDTENWLSKILDLGIIEDGLLAQSSQQRDDFWALREGITESLSKTAKLKKYDVSVAVRALPKFLLEVQELFSAGNFHIDLYLFGHMGDGSPHLNLLKPQDIDDKMFERDCARAEKALFELLKKIGGSVSAEHGVGLLKKHWLKFSRTKEELRLFRAIKDAFDPKGLLNPGKIL